MFFTIFLLFFFFYFFYCFTPLNHTSSLRTCTFSEYLTLVKSFSTTSDLFSRTCSQVIDLSVNQKLSNTDYNPEVKIDEQLYIRFNVFKPKIKYQFQWYHSVPYYPHEEVVKVQNALVGIQKCEDSKYAEYPTCGWKYIGSYKVADSQGFCCNKAEEMLTDPTYWRGELKLGQQSSWYNSFSTGHCFRESELKYNGYIVTGLAVQNFSLGYSIIEYDEDSGNINTYNFTFDEKNSEFKEEKKKNDTYANTVGKYVTELSLDPESAKKIANYSNYLKDYYQNEYSSFLQELNIFNNKILYVPSHPSTHEVVQNPLENSLLINIEQTSKDGSSCDKVGTSYHIFRAQDSFCSESVVGDCLHNQLYHHHANALEDPQDTTLLINALPENSSFTMYRTSSSSITISYNVDDEDIDVAFDSTIYVTKSIWEDKDIWILLSIIGGSSLAVIASIFIISCCVYIICRKMGKKTDIELQKKIKDTELEEPTAVVKKEPVVDYSNVAIVKDIIEKQKKEIERLVNLLEKHNIKC